MLRDLEIIDYAGGLIMNEKINLSNYKMLFAEPEEKHRIMQMVKPLQLEMTELG